MVPVYKALQESGWCTPRILVTGQHREMVRSVLEIFQVVPDFDLDVMESAQTLLSLSVRLTRELADLLHTERPDVVLVQGDTTSAMIAGWLSFYAGCRVGHIEAGLRTKNLTSPFPEEFNRRVIALAAHWHFAPTPEAAANLRAEGLQSNVHVVGNTVIDAAMQMSDRLTPRMAALSKRMPFVGSSMARTVLVTTHRRENLGAPMRDIAVAVAQLADSCRDVEFIVPIHPNPLVSDALRPVLQGRSNVHLVAPFEYDEMIFVLRNAHLVMTDSGGLQEEAAAFNVPVLVLRNETERTEGLASGCSRLVGTARAEIALMATRVLRDVALHRQMATAPNPYGDGTSARQIVNILGASR